jgi:tripartite-type tricarboxylate transporter receptor subunit TctC
MNSRFVCSVLAAAFWFALAAVPALAQNYPTKPIRLIVPFPPGSATDAAARLVAAKLADAFGQSVVIDNRAGASGNIGVELGARAVPDGYTILLGTASTHAVGPATNPRLSYDPLKDFAPVSLIGSSPYVLAVHPSVAAATVKELIALAKTRPGELRYASAGNTSLAHLAGELFSTQAGVKLNHIPYKSSVLAVVDLLAGRIELQFGSIAPTLPHIRSGRLRALAVTGAARLGALPDTPTVIESGLRGFEVTLWFGIFAPARTPPAIVARLNREMVAALAAADMKEALLAQGVQAAPGTPAAFTALIQSEVTKWRGVAKTAGIEAD